jgi:hypothetical protein
MRTAGSDKLLEPSCAEAAAPRKCRQVEQLTSCRYVGETSSRCQGLAHRLQRTCCHRWRHTPQLRHTPQIGSEFLQLLWVDSSPPPLQLIGTGGNPDLGRCLHVAMILVIHPVYARRCLPSSRTWCPAAKAQGPRVRSATPAASPGGHKRSAGATGGAGGGWRRDRPSAAPRGRGAARDVGRNGDPGHRDFVAWRIEGPGREVSADLVVLGAD